MCFIFVILKNSNSKFATTALGTVRFPVEGVFFDFDTKGKRKVLDLEEETLYAFY
jgi:hypothetical protein